MEPSPETWHYGIVAGWWAEFNDDLRPHEIPYYRSFVENGQPALDAGCGAGRLLIPYLRVGLDVDGCDLHVPRTYQTIFVCGTFGLGSSRERDAQALTKFHDHLEPGGTLLLDIEVPYADANQWRYWLKGNRPSLPEAREPGRGRRRAADGSEYSLATRIIELDPLNQHARLEIHAERWRDDALEAEEDRLLDICLYFKSELMLMLERAGFSDIVVHGEHQPRAPTAEDDFLVFAAKKQLQAADP